MSQNGVNDAHSESEIRDAEESRHDVRRESMVHRFVGGLVTILSFVLIAVTLPFSLAVCFKVTQEYERAVVFRLGQVRDDILGPGLIFIVPCVDKYMVADLRTEAIDVPSQEIITKDSVTVSVDAVVYFSIVDPKKAIVRVVNFSASTILLAATSLRNILGTRDLGQMLSEKEDVGNTMQSLLDEATDPWGVKVSRVDIKDIRLPMELQKAMAAEAEATREARAKLVAAKGEIKTATSLMEASRIMVENPIALQLRYLQSLNYVSSHKKSTIVFPFPMEFLSSFLGRR